MNEGFENFHRSQIDDLFTALEQGGFKGNLSNFKLTRKRPSSVLEVTLDYPWKIYLWEISYPFERLDYYFRFWRGKGDVGWKGSLFPSPTLTKKYIGNSEWGGRWDELIAELKEWAAQVKQQVIIPDPWEKIKSQQIVDFSNLDEDEFSTPFTEPEKVSIRQALTASVQNIQKQINLVKKDLEVIKNHFDYLTAALERLNKFDWKSLLVGTMVSIGVNLTVDANTIHHIYEIVKNAFMASSILLLP